MKIAVDGKPVNKEQVGYRPMGFGQDVQDLELWPIVLRLETNEFTNLMRKPFDEFVTDNEEDDRNTAYEDAIPELIGCGYAKFDSMWNQDKESVCRLVKRFLVVELLEALFGNNHSDGCLVSINSIESIVVTPKSIEISGKVFETK